MEIQRHQPLFLRDYVMFVFGVFVLMCQSTYGVVPYPPTMEKQPVYEQLFQVTQTQDEADKPFVLDCVASGNPEPTYRWKKNGEDFDYVPYDKRISQQPRRGTLVFTKPEDIDEGLYQCYAENIHGVSVSNAVFLRKSELNSFPDEKPSEIRVIEGNPLTLDCNPPTGYPKPSIFWIIRSTTGALRSINSSRITVDPEGDLHFAYVTLEDALDDAMYACSATSLFRNEYKLGNMIILKVEVSGVSGQASHPPTKQYVSPPNMLALRGQKQELSCIFGGTPLPDIVWRKKGGSLDSNRITYVNYGKTLVIKNVDFQDEGTYECTASNGQGVPQTHAMAVNVQSAPYWIRSPNNTNAAEEESVKFECTASAVPDPKLQWFVNGVPIEKAPPNPRRKLDGNILTVENLKKIDTAVYQCNASNVHGYAFKDFYLNVLALPPTITEKPEPVKKAVVTSDVTLRCRVFGAPKPEVKWMKDRRELTGGRFQVLENGDLKISDVIVTDQGAYMCYASNKFGDIEAQGTLQVKGKTLITQPPENFEVAAQKSATFRCNADADPSLQLTIQWLFNGKPIDFDRDPRMVQASDNSLTISKTIELDSGIYTCVARTELDDDKAEATLTVQDVPNPPQIVDIECGRQSALVEWQPMGDRRAPILGYTMQYNTSFNPDIWEDAFASIPAPDTRFKVVMSPWANYTFRVIARNKIGASLPSGVSAMCSTPEDVPYKNPDKVAGRGTTPNNLVISWTVMPLIEQNAPGFFYKVYWKRDDIPGARWESEQISDWQRHTLLVPNQPTFKPYRIKVEAHNKKGQANVAATEVIGHSGEDVPLEAPKNFKNMYVKDARSAMFSWDPVSADSIRGHFRGYKIQAWTPDEGEERLREVIVPPNATESLVTIFKPHSRNFVRVLAFNDMYNGPPSDVVDFMTPEGTPGPVASFDALPMGASALYLVWKKPLEPNGVLTGYNIQYQEVNETELGPLKDRQPITDQRETRAKLAGLKPDTKYRVTIRATTSKGPGEPYYIEVNTQKENEMPPDPPNFVWSHLPEENGKAGIQIKWVPAVGGQLGSHFFAQFRKKGEGQWNSTPTEENQDTIIIRGLEPGTIYEARIYAVDGKYQTPSKVEDIDTSGLIAVAAPESTDTIATAAWFIGMMCAIAILLLLLIIVCLIKRNRGGKYSVHEKEVAQGRDLDYPDDGGFNEYTKPSDNQALHRGSRASLNSSLKGAESDTDSMADYGEGDTGKFGEDGSFIGQYGAKKKKEEEPTSPSALATFV